MSDAKTQPTDASVAAFLDRIPDPGRREDCRTLARMMEAAAGVPPLLWGPSIVGFGRYHYRYATGREGEWPILGFSPRKGDLALYLMPGLEHFGPLMARLGKYKAGKSCINLKRLSDVDLGVLEELLQASLAAMADQRVG